MTHGELVPLVRNTTINASLAFVLHEGKGDQWRKVFKDAIQALPVKAGKQYEFLVVMASQSREAMERVTRVLNREAS